jgi:hypothetical protein
MRQTLMTAALACASMLVAAPEKAEAQVFYRPWLRPRIVVMPRPWVAQVSAPPVVVQQAPPMYYPPPYYYPPQPPVYVQQPPVYIQPPAPPPVYLQPPAPPVYMQPPPPPVYAQPAPPPVYMQPPPPPVYAQPPVMEAPPPPAYAARPAYRPPASQWQAKYGFGGRFAAMINTDELTNFSQLGFGGELLARVHRRIVLELAGEYQKRVDNGFARYDVPVTLGMRVHIGAPDWVVSPYFVVAGGAAYSNLDFLHSQDKAWFVDGQLGGGLEIRIGKHVALTADVRGDARHRITDPDEATLATTSVNGKPFYPMQDSYGLQGRLGVALYF